MFAANIIGSVTGWLTDPITNSFWAIGLLMVAWGFKRYVLPLIKTEAQKKLAEYIVVIADDITDQLVAMYPANELFKFIDKAVDKIREICGISEDVAKRAIVAALGRKGIKNIG